MKYIKKMNEVSDINWVVGNRYLISSYKIYGSLWTAQTFYEWKCLETTKLGAIKFKDVISGEEIWLSPTNRVVVFEELSNNNAGVDKYNYYFL